MIVLTVIALFIVAANTPKRVETATIDELQSDILPDAQQDYRNGVLANGPITSVSCDPLTTSNFVTKFDCSAIYSTDSNGTQRGYLYKATYNSQTQDFGWARG